MTPLDLNIPADVLQCISKLKTRRVLEYFKFSCNLLRIVFGILLSETFSDERLCQNKTINFR